MLVLDSNVWIFVATADEYPVEIYSEKLGEPVTLFEDFRSGRRKTAVSAYVLEEIRQGLSRSKRATARAVDRVFQNVCTLIQSCDAVERGFGRSELEAVTLESVREEPHNRLLSELLGIQAKDVPVFSLAFEHRYDKPHVLTDDGGFGDLTPATHGLDNITVEDVSLTW